MTGILFTDGWAGRQETRIEIVAETPKRYRVKLLENAALPGRSNHRSSGFVFLAPKYAVRINQESNPHDTSNK